MSNAVRKKSPKPIPKYSKLSNLIGLMAKFEITVAQLAKAIGRCSSTVSLANNGHNLYDSMDMQNIQKFINSKAAKKENPRIYSIDEIFFS